MSTSIGTHITLNFDFFNNTLLNVKIIKNLYFALYLIFEKMPPHSGHLSVFTNPNVILHLGQYTLAAHVFPIGFGIISIPHFSQIKAPEELTIAATSTVELHLRHL